MNDGLIPKRYAKALLKFAVEKHDDRRVYELMTTLTESYRSNPELAAVVGNPFVDNVTKTKLLTTAAGAGPDDRTYDDFIRLLVDNNRLTELRGIALAYLSLYREANNIYLVNITSAAPLEKSEVDRLDAIIRKHLADARIEYNMAVDPALIGGFVVNIGSERLDASVNNELKQLRLKLLSK